MLGGGGSGSTWIAPTKPARDLLPDAHFMTSTVLRRGSESNAAAGLCALLKFRADSGLQSLDSRLHHTLTCKAGPARVRQHRAIATTLTNVLKQSGAQLDKERRRRTYEVETKGEGEKVVKEAILGGVIVRAPAAERYTTSAKEAAACATMGGEDKVKRCKGKTLPMVMETFGRLGPETRKVRQLAVQLASLASLEDAVTHGLQSLLESPSELVAPISSLEQMRRALWFATADAAPQARGPG